MIDVATQAVELVDERISLLEKAAELLYEDNLEDYRDIIRQFNIRVDTLRACQACLREEFFIR